jgi:hypothetical protein
VSAPPEGAEDEAAKDDEDDNEEDDEDGDAEEDESAKTRTGCCCDDADDARELEPGRIGRVLPVIEDDARSEANEEGRCVDELGDDFFLVEDDDNRDGVGGA